MHSEIIRLRRRRQNLRRQIAKHERQIANTTVKLRGVEQEILALDPQFDLTPREHTRNPYFVRNELGRMVVDVLREAEKPLRRSELVKRVLAAKCGADRPHGMFEFVHHRFPAVLLALKNRGLVERNGGWRLTSPEVNSGDKDIVIHKYID
jgi:hypothetical protein